MIELTAGQQRGLELALRIAKEPRSVGVICGYAGTGKTTLIKTIIEQFFDLWMYVGDSDAFTQVVRDRIQARLDGTG